MAAIAAVQAAPAPNPFAVQLSIRTLGYYNQSSHGAVHTVNVDARITFEELRNQLNTNLEREKKIWHLFKFSRDLCQRGFYAKLESGRALNSLQASAAGVLEVCASPDVLAALAEVHRLYERGEVNLPLLNAAVVVFDGATGNAAEPGNGFDSKNVPPAQSALEVQIKRNGGHMLKTVCEHVVAIVYLDPEHAEAARRWATRRKRRPRPVMSVSEFETFVNARPPGFGTPSERNGWCNSLRTMRAWLYQQDAPIAKPDASAHSCMIALQVRRKLPPSVRPKRSPYDNARPHARTCMRAVAPPARERCTQAPARVAHLLPSPRRALTHASPVALRARRAAHAAHQRRARGQSPCCWPAGGFAKAGGLQGGRSGPERAPGADHHGCAGAASEGYRPQH